MERSELYPKVYMWLTLGLLITFLTGYSISINEKMLMNILSGGSYLIVVILELAVAIFFSLRLSKMSKLTAIICYVLYSFLTGLTFSVLFVEFKITSIIMIFLVTAIIFAIFSVVSYVSKKSFNGIGSFLFMALCAIVIASIVNMFIGSSVLNLILIIIGVIVFIGYIMYDMRKIEMLANLNEEAGPIYAAFQLYLDFINLFIDLLRLFGESKD